MRLVSSEIQKVPNNNIDFDSLIGAKPEVYRIGILADGVTSHYGVFVDRVTRRSYILKYIVQPDKAFVSGQSAVMETVPDESEYVECINAIKEYSLLENFEIHEKKLLSQWFFKNNGHTYLQKDLYKKKYGSLFDSKTLPTGEPVELYNDGDELIRKMDENNGKKG